MVRTPRQFAIVGPPRSKPGGRPHIAGLSAIPPTGDVIPRNPNSVPPMTSRSRDEKRAGSRIRSRSPWAEHWTSPRATSQRPGHRLDPRTRSEDRIWRRCTGWKPLINTGTCPHLNETPRAAAVGLRRDIFRYSLRRASRSAPHSLVTLLIPPVEGSYSEYTLRTPDRQRRQLHNRSHPPLMIHVPSPFACGAWLKRMCPAVL